MYLTMILNKIKREALACNKGHETAAVPRSQKEACLCPPFLVFTFMSKIRMLALFFPLVLF